MFSGKLLNIIILSYNDVRIINSIRSVKRFDDIDTVQIVVIDGGSSTSLVEKISDNLEDSDILISEPDCGIFDGLNKGLDTCECEFIGWLGSDDIFSEDAKASYVVKNLKECDIFVGAAVIADGDRILRRIKAWPSGSGLIKYGFNNPHFSTFAKSKIFKSEVFDISHPSADIGYFLKIFDPTPIIVTNETIYTIMQTGGASNNSKTDAIQRNIQLYFLYSKYNNAFIASIAIILRLIFKSIEVLKCKIFKRKLLDPLLS